MALAITKPEFPKKSFILGRALHLDKNNKVVEEDDTAGVRVLGSQGKAFYEEEAKSYGLDDSHREAVPVAVAAPETKPEPGKVPEPAPAPAPAPEPKPEAKPEPGKGLKVDVPPQPAKK